MKMMRLNLGNSSHPARRVYLCVGLLGVVFAWGCNRDNLRGAIPDVANAKEMRLTLATSEGGNFTEESGGQQRTGWGTIKGTIRVVGPIPPNRVLNVNKDQAVCQPGEPLDPLRIPGGSSEGFLLPHQHHQSLASRHRGIKQIAL